MKKMFVFILALCLCFSNVIAAGASETPETDAYKDVFEEYLISKSEYYTEIMEYEELYSYYAYETTADETTPDYVLVYGCGDVAPAYSYAVFGEYIVHTDYHYPYSIGYYIIVPEENCKVYTLREAWEAELEGIANVFADYGLGRMIGDMDEDRKLTVKDATYIQKCLAEINEFPMDDEVRGMPETTDGSLDDFTRYISDFNGDDVRNIKDATAIQKHIAGLPY